MKRTWVLCWFFVALLALAGFAQAGVYYEAKTTSEGKGAETQASYVKAWVLGEKAKVYFESSGNPFAKEGTYLLSVDGGHTIYLVNPKDKTYSRWDMDAMMGMMAGLGKMRKFEISDGKVEKLEEKPGGVGAGLPTTYYKFRQTYRQKFAFIMMKKESHIEQIYELWAAPELVEKAFGVFLRKTPPPHPQRNATSCWRWSTKRFRDFPSSPEPSPPPRTPKGPRKPRWSPGRC